MARTPIANPARTRKPEPTTRLGHLHAAGCLVLRDQRGVPRLCKPKEFDCVCVYTTHLDHDTGRLTRVFSKGSLPPWAARDQGEWTWTLSDGDASQ